MRCPDCNKFASYDDSTEPQCELEFDAASKTVSGNVRIVLTCQDCGTELKEANFDAEQELEIPDGHEGEGHELEADFDSAELTTRTEDKDKHGKPIKNPRYMKTLYGFSVGVEVRCSCQDEKADALLSTNLVDEIPASAMDELV